MVLSGSPGVTACPVSPLHAHVTGLGVLCNDAHGCANLEEFDYLCNLCSVKVLHHAISISWSKSNDTLQQ